MSLLIIKTSNMNPIVHQINGKVLSAFAKTRIKQKFFKEQYPKNKVRFRKVKTV